MTVAGHAVLGGTVKKLNLLSVVPELGEVVLTQHIGHDFRRQLFPDLIARPGVTGIVQQIGGGDFIHRPAHFQAAKLRAVRHQLGFQADKTVRVCAGSESENRQK